MLLLLKASMDLLVSRISLTCLTFVVAWQQKIWAQGQLLAQGAINSIELWPTWRTDK